MQQDAGVFVVGNRHPFMHDDDKQHKRKHNGGPKNGQNTVLEPSVELSGSFFHSDVEYLKLTSNSKSVALLWLFCIFIRLCPKVQG